MCRVEIGKFLANIRPGDVFKTMNVCVAHGSVNLSYSGVFTVPTPFCCVNSCFSLSTYYISHTSQDTVTLSVCLKTL